MPQGLAYPAPFSSIGNCFEPLHSSLFLTLTVHWIFKILRRQWFRFICSFFLLLVVIRHVSAPYNKTDFMFELNILNFVDVDITDEFQIFFSEL